MPSSKYTKFQICQVAIFPSEGEKDFVRACFVCVHLFLTSVSNLVFCSVLFLNLTEMVQSEPGMLVLSDNV